MMPDAKNNASPEKSADELCWKHLYDVLDPKARVWAFNSGVPTWKGQELDVARDIVQTAMLKLFLYLEEAHRCGTVIASREALCLVIAKHAFLDMRRRELRLRHFSYDPVLPTEGLSLDQLVDPSQEAEEKLYEEWALIAGAGTIAEFSKKLRAAILADLANHSCFDAEPSVLQQAFLASGIRLQDYQCAPSPDPAERSRKSALRSLAYKRLAQARLV